MITELKPNQVFVYGSNRRNFCGAGAASFAFCGSNKNDWRENPLKQLAIYQPNLINPETGRLNRIGRWNTWGVNYHGLQTGYLGQSYDIITVENPGGARVSHEELEKQFMDLFTFAQNNKNKEFIMTKVGCGYAGFSEVYMNSLVKKLIDKLGKPDNIIGIDSTYE